MAAHLNRIKNLATTGFTIVIILAIPIIAIPATYLWLPAKVKYHIVERHTLSVPKGHASVSLGLILPKSGPYQTVDNQRVQWDSEQETESYAHLDVVKLWGEIEEGEPQQVILEYDVTLPQGKTAWNSTVEQKYSSPQTGIESDHPAIIDLAEQLSKDPYRIYQFTSQYLVFNQEKCGETNFSALETFKSATGTCLGYSRLMVALCRAAGIPARLIIGTTLPDSYFPLVQSNTNGSRPNGHAWIEYYSQGNWHIADPSWGQGYLSFLEFNHSDGLHLSFSEYDDFFKAQEQLFNWAARHSFVKSEELTYIITSSKDSISVSTEIGIDKKWDGRWINTILVFALVTILLCTIRNKFFLSRKS
jgi:hypothetical protein